VLLSSRLWSWSRGQICRSWSWTWHLRSWSLTTGLGLAFKQDQDLINFFCAISATKMWLFSDLQTLYYDKHVSEFVSVQCSLGPSKSRKTKYTSIKCRHRFFTDFSYVNLWGHIVPDWENLSYHTLCSWSAIGTSSTLLLSRITRYIYSSVSWYSFQCPCSHIL